MKTVLLGLACLLALKLHAFEYESQFENDQICVARAKIEPHEEIGLHRDAYPQVVIAIKGGTITRLEADGHAIDVQFPTGVAVVRDADPEDKFHRSFNNSSEPVELMIIQLKEHLPTFKKKAGSHDISMNIKISCPESKEFQQFVESIPAEGNYSSSFSEWKSSFIHNMSELVRLVNSEKIADSYWSVKTE